jgi:hypothetical protein
VVLVEFADFIDDGLRDRGMVVAFPYPAPVLAVGDEARHFLRALDLRASARLNFLATDMGTPTFLANDLECAAAAMSLRCEGDLLGIGFLGGEGEFEPCGVCELEDGVE